jgi:RecA-family ATPase
MNIAELINQSRKLEVKVGDAVFFVRRPTHEEFSGMVRKNNSDYDTARECVTGWQNLRAKDLFKAGTDELIEFDKEVFSAAIGDLPMVAKAIGDVVFKEVMNYHGIVEKNAKNSQAGSNSRRSAKS